MTAHTKKWKKKIVIQLSRDQKVFRVKDISLRKAACLLYFFTQFFQKSISRLVRDKEWKPVIKQSFKSTSETQVIFSLRNYYTVAVLHDALKKC